MGIPAGGLAVIVGGLAPVAPVCRGGGFPQGQRFADLCVLAPAPAVLPVRVLR